MHDTYQICTRNKLNILKNINIINLKKTKLNIHTGIQGDLAIRQIFSLGAHFGLILRFYVPVNSYGHVETVSFT